jgi:hypothetical protein
VALVEAGVRVPEQGDLSDQAVDVHEQRLRQVGLALIEDVVAVAAARPGLSVATSPCDH